MDRGARNAEGKKIKRRKWKWRKGMEEVEGMERVFFNPIKRDPRFIKLT